MRLGPRGAGPQRDEPGCNRGPLPGREPGPRDSCCGPGDSLSTARRRVPGDRPDRRTHRSRPPPPDLARWPAHCAASFWAKGSLSSPTRRNSGGSAAMATTARSARASGGPRRLRRCLRSRRRRHRHRPARAVCGPCVRRPGGGRCCSRRPSRTGGVGSVGTPLPAPRVESAGRSDQRRETPEPQPNGARNVWVTETALSTALNTSYMAAAQLSLSRSSSAWPCC